MNKHRNNKKVHLRSALFVVLATVMACFGTLGTGGGEDYMTMREIGNGMTFTGMFVFPPQDEEDPLYGGFDYLLHRQSSRPAVPEILYDRRSSPMRVVVRHSTSMPSANALKRPRP